MPSFFPIYFSIDPVQSAVTADHVDSAQVSIHSFSTHPFVKDSYCCARKVYKITSNITPRKDIEKKCA